MMKREVIKLYPNCSDGDDDIVSTTLILDRLDSHIIVEEYNDKTYNVFEYNKCTCKDYQKARKD